MICQDQRNLELEAVESMDGWSYAVSTAEREAGESPATNSRDEMGGGQWQ